jgi:hypothetical protein
MGVMGQSVGGIGVFGMVTSQTGTGIYALQGASDGWALYASGNARVTGSLVNGAASFRIDDPVNPAHKYLSHPYVGSSDMKNLYDGTVALDENGQATVELPAWFEALNRDFRYQLTALDVPAPSLHVSHQLQQGRFTIAGGEAGQQVSWQVTGIRQDAWANANPTAVESDKPDRDVGRYLHPDVVPDGVPIAQIARGQAAARRWQTKGR